MGRSPARFALRFALAYALLAGLAVLCEAQLNQVMVPCVKAGLSLYAPDIQVRDVTSEQTRLRADLVVARRRDGLRVRVNASVLSNGDRMLVGPLLTLSVILAWGFHSSRERAVGVLLGATLVLAVGAQDIAGAMALGVSGKMGMTEGALAQFYSFFLDSGGRQLMALVCAAAAIHAAAAFCGSGARGGARPAPRLGLS
jgi:hypothetical protein